MAFLHKTVLQFLTAVNYFHRSVPVFQHPGKTILLPTKAVVFNAGEQVFLEASARSFNFEIDYSQGLRQKEVSVTPLQNATLLGNSGAVLQAGRVVVESVFDVRRLANSPAWRMPAFMLKKKKPGLYTSVFHFPWAETSNYHWFLDCLPRVYALAQTIQEPCVFVISQQMPAFQRETLEFVLRDFPNFRIEAIKKQEKWLCERFVLPSFVAANSSGYLPLEVSGFLREQIFNGYNIEQKTPTRRIYLSRQHATKRRIKNEKDLLPILEKYGFEIVLPEKLSYRDQVRLFHEAAIIAGPHGAAFTNTLFAQKATVLELHPANAVKPHYFLLSKGLNLEYQYLIGSEADTKLDFAMDAAALESIINKIV
jgi:hypothetical protein